jgi:PKD repeat protein
VNIPHLRRHVARLRLGIISATAVAAGAALLAGAQPASAAKFCVNQPICPGGTVKPSLQQAIDDADFNNSDDTISIGASDQPHIGKFSHQSSEKITINSAGPDATVLQPDATTPHTLSITGSTGSSVNNLTIVTKNVNGARGLLLRDGVAHGVHVVHSGDQADLTAVKLENAAFEHGVIDLDHGRGVEVSQTGVYGAVRDSRISTAFTGISATFGANITVTRTRIAAGRSALTVGGTSNISIDDSLLVRTGGLGGDCTVAALAGSIVGSHLTVVGTGPGRGICSSAYGQFDTTVNISNSIITGHQADLSRGGDPQRNANLLVQYSNFRFVEQLPNSGGTFTNGAGNITNHDPVFVNPALRDYRLRAPSPLFDAGDPTDQIALDLDGNPRKVDADSVPGARSDMGAFEYQRQAPTAVINAPATATAGDQVAVNANGSSDPDPGDTLTYAWDFGDGTQKTGKSATHAYTSGGQRTITLTVTDSAGVSTTATHQITVAAPPAPPAPPPGNPPSPGNPPPGNQPAPGNPPATGNPPADQPGTQGPGTPGTPGDSTPNGDAGSGTGANADSARDTVAPRVTRLMVAPTRVRIGKALPALTPAPPKTGSIRLRLSEAATVILRIERPLPGRRIGRTCTKPSKRNRRGRPCVRWAALPGTATVVAPVGDRAIRFQGRVSRSRSLRPGRYRVSVLAVDRAGNRSVSKAATFTTVGTRRK